MIIMTKLYSNFGLVCFEQAKKGGIRRNIIRAEKARDYYKYDGAIFDSLEKAIGKTYFDNVVAAT